MLLGLLITARCNAACTHCATSCGPNRHEALSREKIFGLMDEAAELNEEDELVFSISGGEPFLDFPLLLAIVEHGDSLGAVVCVQTNAYWANNDDSARNKLVQLKRAGLDVLGVSVSRFHDEYIRRTRVQRALKEAKEMGISTVLKCARTAGTDGDALESWARASGADDLELFPIHPYLREGASLEAEEYRFTSQLPSGKCPSASLTIREDGKAYTCCLPGGFNDFLKVGDASQDRLEDISDRFLLQGRQQILRGEGPIFYAKEIMARGQGQLLRPAYADVCDLCSHITSDGQLAAIAAEMSSDFELDQLEKALINAEEPA